MSALGGSELLQDYHVALSGEIDQLDADMAEGARVVDEAVSDMKQSAHQAESAFASMGKAILGGVALVAKGLVGLAAPLGAMKVAVEAADKADRRLARSLEMVGDAGQAAIADLGGFTDQLTGFTTESENKIKKLMATAATLGNLQGDDLKLATAAAVGLAAQYEHVGLTADKAVQLIARASKGEFAGFERLGIELDGLATGQEKYNAVLDQGIEGLRSARQESQTTAGGIKRIKNATVELLEAAGRLIGLGGSGGEILNSVADALQRAAVWVENLKPGLDELIDDFKELLGIGSFRDLFDTDVLALQLDRIKDQVTTRIDIIAMRLEQKIGEAFNKAIDALPAWVKDLASGTFELFTDNPKRDRLEGELATISAELDRFRSQGLDMIRGGSSPELLELNREAIQRLVRRRREIRESLKPHENLIERGVDTLSDEELSRRINDLLRSLKESDEARHQQIRSISDDNEVERQADRERRERAFEDFIKDLLDETDRDQTLGVDASRDRASLQSIQTAFGNLRIPGIEERMLQVQEKQLKEQEATRRGVEQMNRAQQRRVCVG